MVQLLKEKLSMIDPITKRTFGQAIINKYYKMAREGDPIIMRDLINRIDGLPKQTIVSDKDNPININVIHSLFGASIRQQERQSIDYDELDTDDDTPKQDTQQPQSNTTSNKDNTTKTQ